MRKKRKNIPDKAVGQKQTYLLFLYKKVIYIILAIILASLCGFAYAILTQEPIYTKTSTVMLVTGIDTQTGQTSGSNNVTLSQIHLPNVVNMLGSEEFIAGSNNIYQKEHSGEIVTSKISIRFSGEESLIFSISYSDASFEEAENKLNAVIENAQLRLKDYLKADNVQLKETGNVKIQSVSYNYYKFILLGFVVGAAIAFGILTLIYFLDNTAKDREEIELLTGVTVLAYVEKVGMGKLGEQFIKNESQKK